MRTGTSNRQLVRRSTSAFAMSALAVVGLMAGLGSAGCERTIMDAPTGQEVQAWQTPFDLPALKAATPYYTNDDLSGYSFALLLVVQNYNENVVAVTLEVNGQESERRYIGGLTQEVFEVTPAMVQQTEAALGLSSVMAEPKLLGRPCPFVVRLKDYVAADGYIMQNSDFVLAPANIFENTTLDPSEKRDSGYLIDAHMACPGAYVLVLRQGHANVIELDRDFVSVNEPEDKGDLVYNPADTTTAQYHPETIQALTNLGLVWLLDAQ